MKNSVHKILKEVVNEKLLTMVKNLAKRRDESWEELYDYLKDELDFETKIDYILNARNPILVEVMCDPAQVLELPLESDVV